MSDLLARIEEQKEAILLGEIGALLHMLGKASSDFLLACSEDSGMQDDHQNEKHFGKLWSRLEADKLKHKFSFTVHGKTEKLEKSFTDFIKKYKGNAPDCLLLKFFNTCHGITSADEKGVVRKKQKFCDLFISTPFGYKSIKIDPQVLDEKRIDMVNDLTCVFNNYLNNDRKYDINYLRKKAVEILQPVMSQALGETRLPANDVTLWAQSYGVASLYKPVLATLALDLDPCPVKKDKYEYKNIKWRLLGVGWNGLGFICRGRKLADILSRQKILDAITVEIQGLLETDYPLGNMVYKDLRGLFFTFPGVDDENAATLAQELARKITSIVRKYSSDELWPFFTLSKPRRTLTMIAKELQIRDSMASLPRVATLQTMEQADNARKESLLVEGPPLLDISGEKDVCPVCRYRGKRIVDDGCSVCLARRQDRLQNWHMQRGNTIWVDEVADTNNRIALLTLRFDLSRWLNGEWLTTIFSQLYKDWHGSKRFQRLIHNQQQADRLNKNVPNHNPVPTLESVTTILKYILDNSTGDPSFKTTVLNTFFQDIIATQDPESAYYFPTFLENLKSKIKDDTTSISADDLANTLFTQKFSPGRLYRIWEETEIFFQKWLDQVDRNVYSKKPQRISFKTSSPVEGVVSGKTYQIAVGGLLSEGVVVYCLDDSKQNFLTIDNLQKFCFRRNDLRLNGLTAVQYAFEKYGIISWLDEDTGNRLNQAATQERPIRVEQITTEPYSPYIVLAFSPVFCQVLFPASQLPDILHQFLDLYDQHFALVQGKLPLHIGTLVSKRKYPLYVLLEAGQQIIDHPSLENGLLTLPWWKIDNSADHPLLSFYNSYPTQMPINGKHSLDSLATINGAQQFWMTPGYFDFDFLGSTADRHRINYTNRDNCWPVRKSVNYGRLCPRPYPLHFLRKMLQIWSELKIISKTQRHQLEEGLRAKLAEWTLVTEKEHVSVFNQFGRAMLRDVYGKVWGNLSVETKDRLESSLNNGLLLETLELFQHVLKED